MKRLMISCLALAAFAAPAFADDGATYELKAGDRLTGTQLTQLINPVGFYSSHATGNGGVVGGNGSIWYWCLDLDQTTGPAFTRRRGPGCSQAGSGTR